MGEKMTLPDDEFSAWVATLPEKHWATYDLSACRLGWDARKNLTTPAQTVDVEAVREVIATLRKCGWLEDANKLSQAIGDKT